MPDPTFTEQLKKRLDGERSADLQGVLAHSTQFQPASYAKDREMAQRAGVSTPAVQNDHVRQLLSGTADQLGISVDELLGSAPKTSSWLQKDQDNGPLAWTSVRSMADIEARHKELQDAEARRVDDVNRARGLWHTGLRGELDTFESLGKQTLAGGLNLIALPSDVAKAVRSAILPDVVNRELAKMEWADFVGKGAREAADYLQGHMRETESTLLVDPKTGEEFINWRSLNPFTGHGAEKVTGMVAGESLPMLLTIATGGAGSISKFAKLGKLGAFLRYATSAPALIEQGRTVQGHFNDATQKFMAQGMTREAAEAKAAPGSLLAGAFSFLAGAPMEGAFFEHLGELAARTPGGTRFVDRVRARLASAGTAATFEGMQEVLNGLGEDAAEYLTYDPDKTSTQVFANAIDNFVGGFGMGGITGGTLHGSHAIQRNQERQFIESLHDPNVRAELARVAPDKFGDYIGHITEGGPVENLTIPAQQWNTYWQSKGEDPQTQALKLGVDISDYTVATQSGGDLVLKTGEVAHKIAGTEHFEGLLEHMSPGLGSPTFGEMKRQSQAEASSAEVAKMIQEDRKSVV